MVAANPSMLVRAEAVRPYNRVLLVDENGSPLVRRSLDGSDAFIFHYPYVTTPCFLLDIGRSLDSGQSLKTEAGKSYQWQGGVGPDNSIVAFSAICSHKLSFPTRSVSFLNYHSDLTRFSNNENMEEERKQVIFCCSERSAYDPANGARVLGGPAQQPLTSIELEYDTITDRIYAIGTRGGELYESFFERFGFRLALDHGIEDVRALVTGSSVVHAHDQYSTQPVSC